MERPLSRGCQKYSCWDQLRNPLRRYDMLIMNVRSYTFPVARKSAQIFKEVNPNGLVLTGGMHASVAPDEMLEVAEFDTVCQGPGEKIIVDLSTAITASVRW